MIFIRLQGKAVLFVGSVLIQIISRLYIYIYITFIFISRHMFRQQRCHPLEYKNCFVCLSFFIHVRLTYFRNIHDLSTLIQECCCLVMFCMNTLVFKFSSLVPDCFYIVDNLIYFQFLFYVPCRRAKPGE